MKNKKKYLGGLVVAFMLMVSLSSCSSGVNGINASLTKNETNTTNSESSKTTSNNENTETIEIELSGNKISVSDSSVKVLGSTVTISNGGTYVFTGELNNGQIIINAPEKDVKLILNGVEMTNMDGSVIHIIESKDTDIILAEGSENTISDGANYNSEDGEDVPNAAIYSMSDLKIKGETNSSLTINGNYNDAIVSKDDLKIKEANIIINAKDDGIRGKDSIKIIDSKLTLVAEGDGLKSDNETDEEKGTISIENSEIDITAGDDGIHSINLAEVLSGNITILDSYEGIESKKINIYDGEISVTSKDDALNVAGSNGEASAMPGGRGGMAMLEGGELNIYGDTIILNSGGDGFDSNGNATMNGGILIVNGPTNNGNGAIDVNGTFVVSGGTLIAVGSSGMAETPSESSSQYSIQVNFEQSQTAGTEVSLVDSSGSVIFSFNGEKTFQSVVYSSDKLVKGETYTFLVNGNEYTSLNIENIVTKYGSESKMMGDGPVDRQNNMNRVAPHDMNLPDDWADMTKNERHEYMEANRPEMPEESFAACTSLSEGDTCNLSSPQGEMEGTCHSMGEELSCMPERR